MEKIISPSDLTLYNDLNIICHIKIINTNNTIDSLANIYKNQYYQCIEFFNINEKVKFGIKIYKKKKCKVDYVIYYFINNNMNYNNPKNKKDAIFDPLIINEKYYSLIETIKNNKSKNLYKLKNSYIKYPNYLLKTNTSINVSEWIFQNIYNHYFCYCKGYNCSSNRINQKCKYNFYLNIIDNNRDIYSKTHYLFIDFIFNQFSPDDTYPVFEKMYKEGFPVHYITERLDIYKKYCGDLNNCTIIIKINKNNYYKYGDFLENYLSLILKLKVVLSCKERAFHFISRFFYNSEYITYIAVGHGVCYFKDYLYSRNRLYGFNNNNKLLIPPSDKIISIAKNYGWKDEDIIKINLPKWDLYKNDGDIKNNEINRNSIFMMFTWRKIKANKTISSYYIKNIITLLRNKKLNEKLKKKKIFLYFSIHRLLRYKYKNIFNKIFKMNNNGKFINQNTIFQCLCKSSLAVTDFSSIVFDFMYRKKPFILYVPDLYDSNIRNIYYKDYYYLIESIKKKKIKFNNIYFSINKTINKIIGYINRNFSLDKKSKKFYKKFGLKKGNNIKKLISYIKNLK